MSTPTRKRKHSHSPSRATPSRTPSRTHTPTSTNNKDILLGYSGKEICSVLFSSRTTSRGETWTCLLCERIFKLDPSHPPYSVQLDHLTQRHRNKWPQKFLKWRTSREDSRTTLNTREEDSPAPKRHKASSPIPRRNPVESLWRQFVSWLLPHNLTDTQRDAARTLQHWFRTHIQPRARLRCVTELRIKFHHQFPATNWSTRLAKLTRTLEIDSKKKTLVLGGKANRPLLEVEENLIAILLKADGIDSGGFEAVRNARKVLVREVQKKLDQIEHAKKDAIKKF
ncbi:hypothetical protein HDU98_008704 [Podochytrium sp. JEL0797]|nr:hypothetical protein HDU98_008704 [Podochytrium sp. JEL0797]